MAETGKLVSVGLLLWRWTDPEVSSPDWVSGDQALQVLLGHMGGPYWAGKDAAAWSIPKGLVEPDDVSLVATAEREFAEELGLAPPRPRDARPDLDLGQARSGSKTIHVLARQGDLDPREVVPGVFEMEWPPRSGRQQQFPEVDRAQWLDLAAAVKALAKSQRVFIDRLTDALAQPAGDA